MLTAYDVGDGDGAILVRDGLPIPLPLDTFASAAEAEEFLAWVEDRQLPIRSFSITVARWRSGEG